MSKKLYYTKTILFPLFFSHCKSGNLLKVYRYKKWPKAPIRDRLNGHKNNRISAAVQLFFYVLLAKKRNFKLKKKKLIRQFQLFLVFLKTQNRIMLIMNCNNMLNCSEIKLNSNMKKNVLYQIYRCLYTLHNSWAFLFKGGSLGVGVGPIYILWEREEIIGEISEKD